MSNNRNDRPGVDLTKIIEEVKSTENVKDIEAMKAEIQEIIKNLPDGDNPEAEGRKGWVR